VSKNPQPTERLEARREAAGVVVVAPALLGVLAVFSRTEGWDVLGLPWWLWLVLAVPSFFVCLDLLFVRRGRSAALALLGVVVAGNVAGLVILVAALVTTHGNDLGGGQLLFTAAAIWTTNVVAFGIFFWELDRGGPDARTPGTGSDFRFPQDETPPATDQDWRPSIWDYLYLSLTNSTAFSPTDAMPLTVRAKLLMAIEGVLSLILVVLVTARAVNVLGT
jgi:hypothetical protein